MRDGFPSQTPEGEDNVVEDNETEDSADFLNAIPSDAAANSYCTIERMYTLTYGISSKLSEKWNAFDAEEQARILIEGTRLIDQFRDWSTPKVAGQALAFPRSMDAADVIDARVERALLEYVKYRCDGRQITLKNLQKESVTSQNIGGQTTTQRADITELPAGTKRELLRIARSQWPSVRKNRSYGAGDCHTQSDGSLFG